METCYTAKTLLVTLLITSALAHAEDLNVGDSKTIETVDVIGSRASNYTEITAQTEKLMDMAGAFGDPISAVSTLPGIIIPVGETEPAVRGSSPNDNTYYVDGIPAGYIFHEFNTSILDKTTIQNFDVYTAGFGAQYAGATGAVFDIRLRDPKQQALTTTVTASLIRSGVLVEGSVTENSAFYASYRRGLLQYFIPEEDEDEDDDGIRVQSPPEDDDYLLKYQWNINDHHQLVINAFGASDFIEAELSEQIELVATNPDFAGDAKIDNRFQSHGVNYLFQKDDTALNLIFAQWKDGEDLLWGDEYFINLQDETTLLKSEFRMALGNKHNLTAGLQQETTSYQYDSRSVLFVCTEFDVDCQAGRRDVVEAGYDIRVKEHTAYIMDFWQVTPSISAEIGLQFRNDSYLNESYVHPRIAVDWMLNDAITLTSSAGSYDRFPDIDFVIPEFGNPELKPYTSDHYTLGVKGDINDRWNWSVESYYKTFSDLPLALDENQPDAEQLYASDTSGHAYGLDVFINRNFTDKWYGWMSLSYSHSERQNDRTQQSQEYRFDTPFVFNLVANRKLGRNWEGGVRLLVKSGEATTEIIGIQANPHFEGRYMPEYGPAFQDRLPTYSRVDLRFQRNVSLLGNDGLFFIDILNALNTENVEEITLDYNKINATGEFHTQKEVGIGLFPSVGVTFSF